MADQKDKVFRFASLEKYSLWQRTMIRAADLAFYFFISLLGSTLRIEIDGQEHLDAIWAADKVPIYTFWHDRILLFTYKFRGQGAVVMTSRSFDGEYIARFIQRFGFGAIRGSSSRGGSRALVEMIKAMRDGHAMAFTLDGPRGPRHRAKPGPIMLAKQTGNPILPAVSAARRYWTLNSWDRLQVPVPFTKAIIIGAEPFYVKADADEAEIAESLAVLQQKLDDLTGRANEWSKQRDSVQKPARK
ncbi:MAG TPA: lysophospholipid acyltransferase family protein [Pyrinomonadaceae bacterium]|nr:lysophospholipid acyltransferase family protein [Pyrinomonadaceae bacterium]